MAKTLYIGIETIFRDVLLSNYGSIFQHYALRRVLKRLGYAPFRCEHDSLKMELMQIVMPLRLIRLWFLYYIHIRSTPPTLTFGGCWLRLKFIRDYWGMIGLLFERQRHKNVHAYIAGGDSVWCRTVKSDYLLDKPIRVRRISYAASSAWDKCISNPKWRDCMKSVANSYFAVGVRESAGAQAISALCPRVNVSVVEDPVMLLRREELLEVAKPFGPQYTHRTMLYYAVNIWDAESLNLKAILSVARALNCELKIVGIQGAEKFIPPECAVHPSPRRFLAMLRDAECVLTNSFHGLVFSLLLRKTFAFISQGTRRYGNQNCRQYELLGRYSQTDRILSSAPSVQDILSVLNRPLDWGCIANQITKERARSLRWLQEALS